MKKEAIESYLAKHIDKLDRVVEDVVLKLPNGDFYEPEIHSLPFVRQREKMNQLIQKKNSFAYRGDNNVEMAYKKALKKYEEMLEKLVTDKRLELKEELLNSSDELKSVLLFLMIYRHNLLKRLRSYM